MTHPPPPRQHSPRQHSPRQHSPRQHVRRVPGASALGAVVDASTSPASAGGEALRQLSLVAGEAVVVCADIDVASVSDAGIPVDVVPTAWAAPGRLSPSVELVLIVELGAVPMLDPAHVERLLAALHRDDAAVVGGVPVTDALKHVEDGRLIGSVPREGLVSPAGPAIVRRSALEQAAATLSSVTVWVVIDDLFRAGAKVRIVGEAAGGGRVPSVG